MSAALRGLLVTGLLFLGGCGPDVAAGAPQAALELTGRVVDSAEILEPVFESNLTEELADLERDTLVQLVVVTTPDLGGADISDYSRNLGNAWGLGDAERNDGLLIVVAPNERKVRIEVGLGLEDEVTNDEASLIIQDQILPHFRNGDYQSGIKAGVEGLVHEVSNEELKEAA